MNANIFSCTVHPLLVLETQIIHPELLQSLCINPCVPLGSIFLADVCARAEASAGACGRRRVRARADICAHMHPSARALRQHGSRSDTSASLKLPKVKKKKLVKFFLHADVRLKRTDGQVCRSLYVLNRRLNLHNRLVREP